MGLNGRHRHDRYGTRDGITAALGAGGIQLEKLTVALDLPRDIHAVELAAREGRKLLQQSGFLRRDVLFLADTAGDFGRFVPYQMSKPRPVIGTEGLRASAWDPVAERFGAPQVEHRFARLAKRDMDSGDWATWAAVHAVVEAAIRKGARDAAAVEKALAEDELPIDVSKGIESSFRPWDRQLRQAVMLHSADAVVAYAPFAQFLHRRTPLDTLGADLEESPCRPK